MYQFFHRTAAHLRSEYRDDILSLLGNAGKQAYVSVPELNTFSLKLSFTETLTGKFRRIANHQFFKPLAYMALACASLTVVPAETSFAAETQTKTFIATAYYTPVPGQQSYYRGSYEADIALNGNGTHGASGMPVFAGMIAAPKSYAFGTQIFFEGLGLGVVHDRGGAITTTADGYDRIDIWMGYGDAGLKRTQAWGRREVKGTIVTDDSRDKISFEAMDTKLFSQFLAVKGGISSTTLAQLAELGYTPKDGDVKGMIVQFQLDKKVITSTSDDGAGTFGPRTTAALRSAYADYQSAQATRSTRLASAESALVAAQSAWQQQYEKVSATVEAIGAPRMGDKGQHVQTLQSFLAERGYTTPVQGTMVLQTVGALRKYQNAKGLKISGVIDDPTRSAMIDDILTSKH